LRDEKIQKKINNQVLEANKKRATAYEIEQEALKILEKKVFCTKA